MRQGQVSMGGAHARVLAGAVAMVALVAGGIAGGASANVRVPVARTAAVTFMNSYQSELTCASAGQCTAIGANGVAETFSPTKAGKVIRRQTIAASLAQAQSSFAIDCVSVRACVAADARGDIAVFNPRSSRSKSHGFSLSTPGYQTAIDCPSRKLCVADNWQGEAVFNPAHLGSPKTAPFAANGNGSQPSLSCPKISLCVGSSASNATGAHGFVYSFNPRRPAAAVHHKLRRTLEVGSLACPTTGLCVAMVAPTKNPAVNIGLVSFNPRKPGNPAPTRITESTLEFLTCVSKTLCAAAGNNEGVFIFNPKSPRHHHFTALPLNNDADGIAFAGRSKLVILTYAGMKAVINPQHPPKSVRVVKLGRRAAVKRG